MIFDLVAEYPKGIRRKRSDGTEEHLPVRVYRTRHPENGDKPVETYHYHLAFPRKMVEPVCQLLETCCYWGNQHCHEDGDFWVWWGAGFAGPDEPPPMKQVAGRLRFYLASYRECCVTLVKMFG